MEIAPGIHQIRIPMPDNPLGRLNCYLLDGEAGYLMIDTGWNTRDAFAALKAELGSLGLGFTDLSTIVVTHVHPDHFGLAGRIRQISPDVKVLAHQWECDLIQSRYIKFAGLQDGMGDLFCRHGVPASEVAALVSASMPVLRYVSVTLPDRVLYGGETISTGLHDLEVIWTPGHSPGHICLYEPKNRLLFSGDHILPSITPNVSYNVQSGDNPLGDYMCSLQKLRKLPVARVLPGHEEVFSDLEGRIRQIMEHHERRKAEVDQIVGRVPQSAYRISSQITWNLSDLTWDRFPLLHKRAAVTETIAHLECMRCEGRVERVVEHDRVRYSVR